ncbi:MAG: TonB-dependent receptor [Leptospiraceae bacterium]|nr:TonB-dependent receptor [Leptospiraceae bacterium]
MNKISKVLSIFLFLISLFGDLKPQETNSTLKKVAIGTFQPTKSKKVEGLSEDIQVKLKDDLESKGFIVKILGGDLKGNLAISKTEGFSFYIDGYYKTLENNKNLSIYSQIYNPDTGYMIDAVNITDEILGLEDIKLDDKETLKSKENSIKDFSNKATTRLRTNVKRIERRENIEEAVFNTSLNKDHDFPIAKENIEKSSEEVFKLLAEKQVISVASNVVKDANKQPVSVTLINRQQIKMSGARTVNEVLTIYVPGFFTVEDQDDTIAGFRGFAPDNNAKVLLLINGHNMNTEWFWGPPDAIINGLNLEYIERIEVIRGPGSVTLGQGALLGVINIITRNANTHKGLQLNSQAGGNNYYSGTLSGGFEGKELKEMKGYFHVSSARYNGQDIRSEGWARSQSYAGQEGYYDYKNGLWEVDSQTNQPTLKKNVATSGSRLKRSYNDVVTSIINYKGLEFTAFYGNQIRDMYNFYRDRNRLENTIKNGAVTFTHDFTERVSLKIKSYYTVDDIFLRSNNGLTLGGTRELRYGGSVILGLNDLIKNNNLAIGVEFRKYDMGLANTENNNFILNYSQNSSDNALLIDREGKTPNQRNRYVYPGSIAVQSFFVEDFYKLNDKIDIFGAFRYDKHPYWGGNVAPRIGTLYSATSNLRFRLSYQEGFRGVVGVSYTGGFEGDGHLRIQNFSYVQPSNIPNGFDSNGYPTSYYGDSPKTKPEKMKSHEFAINYSITSNLSIESIFFYNRVQKIIDVGVLYCDPPTTTQPGPNGCVMPRLGNDIPGNWNGYWFYKNNPGEIRQGGAEISINYKRKLIDTTFSYSLVRLITASPGQTDSVYLTNDPTNRQFRGYPSSVFRWNTFIYPTDRLSFSIMYLYYPSWYSPKNSRVEGNHLMNLAVNFKLLENLEIFGILKNTLNQTNLYPMISNSGGRDISDGTPAIEKRTYWLGLNYSF